MEEQLVAQEGLGLAVGRCLGIFFTENDMVVSQDPGLIMGALNVLIGLFRRYGLVVNFAKYKAVTCNLGTLRYRMSEESVVQRYTRRWETYCKRPRWQIPCPDWGVNLTIESMKVHVW